jgi:hypothetical protein
MSNGPEWFAPKRYGLGAGLPISWQGWALLLGYMAVMIGSTAAFADKPLAIVSIVVPATITLLIITARTTRGGWRWRWGEEKKER